MSADNLGLIRTLVGLRDIKRIQETVRQAEAERSPLARKTKAAKALKTIMRFTIVNPTTPREEKALRAMAKRAESILLEPKPPQFKRHDGTIGDATSESLIEEAEWACKFLMVGKQALMQGEIFGAMDAFFKASTIATSIIFTANTHGIGIPDKLVDDMNCVISESMAGLKKIFKFIVAKGIARHEARFHTKHAHEEEAWEPAVRRFGTKEE